MSNVLAKATRTVAGIGQSAQALSNLLNGSALKPQAPVTLAGVALQDFEIPSRVRTGVDQSMAVHRFPGGYRTIDCMGGDPHDVGWTGVMLGASANTRARTFEGLVRSGRQVQLVVSGYSFTVVVRSCSCDHGFNRVDYQIVCTVIPPAPAPAKPNATQTAQKGAANALTSLSSAISSIANTAGSIVSTASQVIGSVTAVVTPITNALGLKVPYLAQASLAVSEAGAAVNALNVAGSGVAALSGAVSALNNAGSTITSGVSACEKTVGAIASTATNGMTAAQLNSASNAAGQQVNLIPAFAGVSVASKNLGGSPAYMVL